MIGGYTIQEISGFIEDRSGCTATPVSENAHYLDVDGKVGKEILGPLADEGVSVTTVRPMEDGSVRLWFTDGYGEDGDE